MHFTKKKLLVLGVSSLVLYFFLDLGIQSISWRFKNKDKLDYVQGTVTGTRIIKHEYTTKRQTVLQNVLVLSIEGTDDEFGFTDDSESYQKLFGFREIGKTAEIYYDAKRKRIEEGVTLHVYDLKIGHFQVIDINKERKENLIVPIICFILSLGAIIMAVAIIRSKENNRFDEANFSNADDY